MSVSESVSGSCLCGKITLTITSFDRQVIACHCTQCRKQTGNYVTAASVADSNLTVNGKEHLGWYAASDFAKRGFCRHCASLLLWKHNDSKHTSVMAGCLDAPTGLTTVGHIYTADKGDYYSIDDGLPQFPGSD